MGVIKIAIGILTLATVITVGVLEHLGEIALVPLVFRHFGVSGPGALAVKNPSHFEELVFYSGKGAFVKFYAPWCGHCKRMKSAWDDLADAYNKGDKVTILDVDCTAEETKPICRDQEVGGYPTIKYYNSTDAKGGEFEQGRSFKALSAFVEASFDGPMCSLKNKDKCSEEQLKIFEEFGEASESELASAIKVEEEKLKALAAKEETDVANHEAEAAKLQKKINIHRLLLSSKTEL